MAITASFTADVVSGCSPLTVVFTDTSTGSPTNWFWDFGDGETSGDQNPSHTYDTDGTYTVTLKAWDSSGTTFISPGLNTFETRTGGSVVGQVASWTPFSTASWTISSSGANIYQCGNDGGGKYNHTAYRGKLSYDFALYPNATIIIEGRYWYAGGQYIPASFARAKNEMISLPNNVGAPAGEVYKTWLDVSSYAGSAYTLEVEDANGYSLLPDPGSFFSGWYLLPDIYQGARATAHTVTSQDTITKPDFIHVGPPVVDFSLAPQVGPSPLSVAFTNLSTGGTSYSWRRRRSGTQDPFVEFSTLENPTEIFDKTNP